MSWRYLAASEIGSSHGAQALPCQDASLVARLGDDSLLLVASDGAGSAKYSDEASRIACATVQEELQRFLDDGGSLDRLTIEQVDRWIEAVVSRLHLQATVRDVRVRELACTLLVAIVSPRASHFVQIGDGAIVVNRGDGFIPATWPANGEYANTTFFITDDRALEHLRLQLNEPPVIDVAVFTDGLQMLALSFADRRAHTPFFSSFFAHLGAEPPGESLRLQQRLIEYLGSPAINSRTDDDKSLILASWRVDAAKSE